MAMTATQNDRMTLVGPGTQAGRLLRHYWQPVALIEEFDPQRPLKAVRVMGQNFVLFRDEQGRYGMLDRDCPHRGADLAFGRLEGGGVRCLFHGWSFDVTGRCLDTPAEPAGSRMCDRIRQRAYPVAIHSGIVFAYLGEGTPPAMPRFDCFVAPETHTFAFKGHIDCNWLQALEVGIDPAHASYLHRFFQDGDPDAAYGKQFRGNSVHSSLPMTKVLREFSQPQINVETTDYGLRLITLRNIDEQSTHVRVTNLVFPQAFVIPLSSTIGITQWHVPVDDGSCYWYAIFTSFTEALDKEQMRKQRLELYELPDYKPRLNRLNDYGFDVDQQRTATFTGMGFDINVHDAWAVESQGRIQDRTREHLATSDKGIASYRRMLLDAITKADEGQRPLMALDAEAAQRLRGPTTIDVLAPAASCESYWKEADAQLRRASDWAINTL